MGEDQEIRQIIYAAVMVLAEQASGDPKDVGRAEYLSALGRFERLTEEVRQMLV